MSTTSSQYYRGANTHPHYPGFSSSNEQQFYVLAASWQQDPNHAPYTGPPSASFLHYPQGGADSISNSSAAPQPWSGTSYARQNLQGWDQPVSDNTFASRSAGAYDAAGGNAPVPHQQHPEASRQYQQSQILNPRTELDLSPPSEAYQNIDRFNELRTCSESPANTADPPFTIQAQRTLSIPQPLQPRSRTAPIHLNNSVPPMQPPTNVVWEPRSEIPPVVPQQFPEHTNHALVSRGSISNQSHQTQSPATSWPIVGSGEVATEPPGFPRIQNEDHRWSLPQIQPDHVPYAHQPQLQQSIVTTASVQTTRRPSTKKKAAKVPSSFVERQEKLKVSKRRGPLQEKQREKTHTMRKTKRICVRCRFYKSGCDEGDPCEKCEKITGHARSFREPCYREHLEDTSLIRRYLYVTNFLKGNGREHQEEAEFLVYDWVNNSQLYEMEIMWNLPGYGQIPNAQPIRVTFRPYSPRRGSLDIAASVWTNKDGEIKTVEQPAYAIYDTANLVPAFEMYFSSLQPAIEAWIFSRISHDDIASLTCAEVLRMRRVKGSKALDLAMRLQCLSVVSQGYGSVWSNNIPGIREYDYRRLGRSDYEAYDRKAYDRPLPGAITHQMDVAAVKYLQKLERLFVKELATLIFKPKIKPCANDYIKSKNGTLIENQVNNVVRSQIKKWEFAFPVLLYHWRCTLRGYSPFKLARDNPEELREKGHIDEEGFQYVTKIASMFERSGPDRFQPPITGFASTQFSVSSEWIGRLFKEAGA
ncbi:hypothetical protein GQ44DRAFT_730183 [Phaeosphaeriaceae sp. PMI808]|nr:hypothetical protein GQ44DRAFT_730183 [Phaeosphaeriaceae sp. PMI808]